MVSSSFWERADASIPPNHASSVPYYNSIDAKHLPPPFGHELPSEKAGGVRPKRRRINIASVFLALLMPWFLFTLVSWAMAFSLHYHWPITTYSLVGVTLILVLAPGVHASRAAKLAAAGSADQEPSWMFFCFATGVLAWCSAVGFGEYNYYHNMLAVYDITNLNTYPLVNPAQSSGRQLMDAGRVIFTEGTKLDLTKAIGFKSSNVYCVAPVSISGSSASPTSELATYDFWAVGINCCNGLASDYHCGEYHNPHVHAGVRFLRNDQYPMFKLAVQQAEAAFGIKAAHPIFLRWTQDPIGETNAFQENGYNFYIACVIYHFILQLGAVLVAMLLFIRFGRF